MPVECWEVSGILVLMYFTIVSRAAAFHYAPYYFGVIFDVAQLVGAWLPVKHFLLMSSQLRVDELLTSNPLGGVCPHCLC